MDVAHTDAVGLAGRQDSRRFVHPDPDPTPPQFTLTPPFTLAMRKQGLVHLHALCTLLREDLQNREGFKSDSLDGDPRATSPAAIHRPKDEHRRAVDELATEIAAAVDRDGPRTASDGGTNTTVPEDGTETTAEGS